MPKTAIACETSAIGVSLVYGSQMVAAVAAPFMRLDYMRDKLAILPVEDELPGITYSMVWRSDLSVVERCTPPATAIPPKFSGVVVAKNSGGVRHKVKPADQQLIGRIAQSL